MIGSASYALLVANVERLANVLGKAGYRPDQPRVPRGQPDGGQWVDEGGEEGEDGWLAALQRRLTEPLVLASDNPERRPEVPEERPPTTRERNTIAVAVAKFLYAVTPAIREYEMAEWLYDHAHDRIVAYLEPPRRLDDLYAQGVGPKPGYDLHHIVERVSARDGFSREVIDSADNTVLIPTYRHWQITAWFNTSDEEYGWLTPREFLRSEPWYVRRQVGLKALRRFGVLK